MMEMKILITNSVDNSLSIAPKVRIKLKLTIPTNCHIKEVNEHRY